MRRIVIVLTWLCMSDSPTDSVMASPHDPPHTRSGQKPAAAPAPLEQAKGLVFDDRNKNGKREEAEPGLEGIKVSNGRDIVKTDAGGRYLLPVDDDDVIFVIKPRNWMTPVSEHMIPQFYYNHKPKGSPPGLRFSGVEPTGPLPSSIDFALWRREEPDMFKALFFGDTQPRDVKEVEFIAHDVIEPLIEENKKIGASFGVTLGDVVFDDLSVFAPLKRAVALLGIPWYNVIGNHDTNHDAKDDKHSDETWEREFGPAYYSFDHGPVHFLVLDDIRWFVDDQGRGRYEGGFGPEQIGFIRKDLSLIPEDQLVVLMMHIPLPGVADRKEVYDMIAKRPFSMSISAHTHYQEHIFIKSEDGFTGPKPHHHVVNVTVCGSWWRGAPDERGIPHATMRDGAPNGYSIVTFNGEEYAIEYRPAGRPPDYQMNIYLPEEIEATSAAETEVLVNVFAGSEKSKVELRVGATNDWIPMARVPLEDPAYAATKAREDQLLATILARRQDAGKELQTPFIPLPEVIKSPHIWRAKLPGNLKPGSVLVEVRETDMFGKVHDAKRSVTLK